MVVKEFRDIRGVTLVELMVTLVILSIIMVSIYTVYSSILKTTTTERKVAKTELDVLTVIWPFIKEVQTAGFGVPKTGTCTPAISYLSGVLTIHSTAAGDSKDAGKASYIGEDCVINDIPEGENVVVISGITKENKGTGIIEDGKVKVCQAVYTDLSTIAYWVPSSTFPCYETSYKLENYTIANKPAMCVTGTKRLSRSVSTTDDESDDVYQPMIECVRELSFRFGCIDSGGDLTWSVNPTCTSGYLRLLRIGMVVQTSPKTDIQGPAILKLFEDLETEGNHVTVVLTDEQRYYKWKKIDQTIALRNLE